MSESLGTVIAVDALVGGPCVEDEPGTAVPLCEVCGVVDKRGTDVTVDCFLVDNHPVNHTGAF
jgi:hypothetical protein